MNKEELVHLAACTNLNSELGRYVARVMDEANDNGHTEYTTPIDDVKRALGAQMVELGEALQRRLPAGPLVIEHVAQQEDAVHDMVSTPPRRKPDIPEL